MCPLAYNFYLNYILLRHKIIIIMIKCSAFSPEFDQSQGFITAARVSMSQIRVRAYRVCNYTHDTVGA